MYQDLDSDCYHSEDSDSKQPSHTEDESRQELRDAPPNLRFDDGDLLVKLGAHPESWLLLHSQVVRRFARQLAPALDERWGQAKTRYNPVTGTQTPLYVLALKATEATMILEGQGKEYGDLDSRDRIYVPFHESRLWTNTITAPYDRRSASDVALVTSRAYIQLFSLLYGCELPSDHVMSGIDSFSIYDPHDFQLLHALASYHGALERVATVAMASVMCRAHFWGDVAYYPSFWLQCAENFRCQPVFFDALRHLISTDYDDMLADALVTSIPRARSMCKSVRQAMHDKTHGLGGLQVKLMRLQRTSTAERERLAELKHGEVTNASRDAHASMAAKIAFGAWFSAKLSKSISAHQQRAKGRHECEELGVAQDSKFLELSADIPLALACREIRHFDVSKHLGTQYWESAIAFVPPLSQCCGPATELEIHSRLKQLFWEARELIKSFLKTHHDSQGTWRTTRHQNANTFTYLPLHENIVPWGAQNTWSEVKEMPEVDWTDASEATMRELGIIEDGEDEDVSPDS